MIDVYLQGQTGNQLMQYSFGRILASILNYDFACDPIPEFPELVVGHLNGERFVDPGDCISISQTSQCPTVLDWYAMATFRGFKIRLHGYFERAAFYEAKRHMIQQWFAVPHEQHNTIGVHIRGTDGKHHSPPLSYYTQAINQLWAEGKRDWQIVIVTDDIEDDVVKTVASHFGAHVTKGSVRGDFEFMRSCAVLVIGNSTFAWWAAFLSDADVIQPEPTKGFRSWEMPNTDLRMAQWKQIKYVPEDTTSGRS